MVTVPEGFAEFVASRSPALLRSAWLLTGDWFTAQDLVQVSLAKTWPRWDRVLRRDDPEVYVRRVMFNTYATWRRRRWHGERVTEYCPSVLASMRATPTLSIVKRYGPPWQRCHDASAPSLCCATSMT